jgi:hypothetical protein
LAPAKGRASGALALFRDGYAAVIMTWNTPTSSSELGNYTARGCARFTIMALSGSGLQVL